MTTYTANYDLDLYEADDNPNLLDQYNSSMNKIDKALDDGNTESLQISNDFAAYKREMTQTISGINTAIGSANTNSSNALTAAQQASSKADSLETSLNQTVQQVTAINNQLSGITSTLNPLNISYIQTMRGSDRLFSPIPVNIAPTGRWWDTQISWNHYQQGNVGTNYTNILNVKGNAWMWYTSGFNWKQGVLKSINDMSVQYRCIEIDLDIATLPNSNLDNPSYDVLIGNAMVNVNDIPKRLLPIYLCKDGKAYIGIPETLDLETDQPTTIGMWFNGICGWA